MTNPPENQYVLDVPLPTENRMSIASFSGLPNGVNSGGPSKPSTWTSSNWGAPSNAISSLTKPPPGRDPKSRARSRDYLKQYVDIPVVLSPFDFDERKNCIGVYRKFHI